LIVGQARNTRKTGMFKFIETGNIPIKVWADDMECLLAESLQQIMRSFHDATFQGTRYRCDRSRIAGLKNRRRSYDKI